MEDLVRPVRQKICEKPKKEVSGAAVPVRQKTQKES
jgi:hypothetical protein